VKYYIISGEASGDLHGSHLMRALQEIDPMAEFRFWGGEKMQAVGGELVTHYRDMAFMGFWEVFKNLRYITKKMRFCKEDILQYQPDALILIDYPGFNLRIAEFAKKAGFKVFYYISPQVWAWKSGRVEKIRTSVDRLFTILPFEKDFFAARHYDVSYVGHPLIDLIPPRERPAESNLIAVLPGSREQEIKVKLPIMLSLAKAFPQYQFCVAKAPGAKEEWYAALEEVKNSPNVVVVNDSTYELLSKAHAAVVTSGTATLETALFGVPQVVCYKGNPISYAIGKRVVKIKFISLVNLILNRPLVMELIQHDMNPNALKIAFEAIVETGPKRDEILAAYSELRMLLGQGGAAKQTASEIFRLLH
jgi:lipid-A-disaccharide synthase